MEDRLQHPYHMYDEIMLQPEYLKRLFLSSKFKNHGEILTVLKNSSRVFLVGCGTSYNAALSSFSFSQMIFKRDNKFNAIPARELMSPNYDLNSNDTIIAFSHSGDTKATFDCLKLANDKSCNTILITGDTVSKCAGISDFVLTYGYKEDKSLAHTITYSLSSFLMLTIMGKLARKMGFIETSDMIHSASIELPSLVGSILKQRNEIRKIAKKMESNFYLVGGSESTLSTAAETALKFGEVHYTPTTFMDVEQVFHGPLVMCDDHTGIIVVNSNNNLDARLDELFKATKNIGCKTLLVTTEKSNIKNSDYMFQLPYCHEILVPLVYMIPLQLMSYYISVNNGLNPDHIRRDQTPYKKAREAYE
ncbi:SIS domain-containing protein [Sediminibacillus albus]|uniref:Glutamine--fructose-6-phosphate aminotransferase [isomerizing] n=1 Tax=Sediminibacillus albus TaxID=407036 RepID=A0A1G8YCT5_9BACI|nr:SIS domain-containing protein [Sediminibacillus albus]SDK00506.1 SIS domain-containing protein [Sediminibacillus albus]